MSRRNEADHEQTDPISTPTSEETTKMKPRRKSRGAKAWFLGALIVLAVAAFVAPTAAQAEFDITSFSSDFTDSNGDPETQAGARPFAATTDFTIPTEATDFGPAPDGTIRNIAVDMPVGFVGDPGAAPTCKAAQLAIQGCPLDAAVGTATLHTALVGDFGPWPLYNMVAPDGTPARFGFQVSSVSTLLSVSVRPNDAGVRVRVDNASQALSFAGTKVTLWGVPADPVHDNDRGFAPFGFCFGVNGNIQVGTPPCSAGISPAPFLNHATQCTGEPQVTTIKADTWENPGEFKTASYESPPLEGCDVLAFDPTVDVEPENTEAAAPSAYEVRLTQTDNESPNGLVPANLKKAVVTLPEGVAINPAAANGLEACSQAEIGLGTEAEPSCPAASRVGSVKIDTPVLDDPLEGYVYQAAQNDNPFNDTLAVYMVPKGSGVMLKLAGHVEPDPDTGQLKTTFDDNPDLPFTDLKLRFKGGAQAVLVNPPTCGSKTTEWSLASQATPNSPVEGTDTFTIDQGPNGKPCAASLEDRPFDPTLSAGVTNPVAGSYSPFVFQLTREDGDQEILSTTVKPPQGLTAKLAGIPYCSEADIAAISCPEQSKVGTEIVGAGAGSSPFYTSANPGSVYLAGPYKGAPLSFVIQEPVIAGPLDLDDISVRAAIHVDPRTAELTVISDEIPQINSGIPLRIRDLRIKMDRPDFTIAPTNCDPMQVGATVQGSHGATANLTNHFQVGDCGSLGFSPKLKLDLGNSRKATKPGANPPLNANLKFNEGDSNISRVQVALPQGVLLDDEQLGFLCSQSRYEAGTCPESSVVGYAKATTPLLDDPVEGPVYLKASTNPLPDLAADLNGQIDIDLIGRIDQKQNKKGINQIRNTFDVVPDVPVSSFELKLSGGNAGLLENSSNLCSSKKGQKVGIKMAAHNAMTLSERPLIGSACKQLNKKKAKKLKQKAKKLQRKARKADNPRKAKKLRKKARKLKKQARKLGR